MEQTATAFKDCSSFFSLCSFSYILIFKILCNSPDSQNHWFCKIHILCQNFITADEANTQLLPKPICPPIINPDATITVLKQLDKHSNENNTADPADNSVNFHGFFILFFFNEIVNTNTSNQSAD